MSARSAVPSRSNRTRAAGGAVGAHRLLVLDHLQRELLGGDVQLDKLAGGLVSGADLVDGARDKLLQDGVAGEQRGVGQQRVATGAEAACGGRGRGGSSGEDGGVLRCCLRVAGL